MHIWANSYDRDSERTRLPCRRRWREQLLKQIKVKLRVTQAGHTPVRARLIRERRGDLRGPIFLEPISPEKGFSKAIIL